MGGPVRDPRGSVRRAREGSAGAIDELFRAHWPAAHRAAYLVVHDSAAAEDIAQESFLAALRALDRFDRRRPFGPWLHRIVVNRAIDHVRRRALAGGGGPGGGRWARSLSRRRRRPGARIRRRPASRTPRWPRSPHCRPSTAA